MTFLTFQYKVEALDFIAKDSTDNIKRKIGECIDTALKRHIENNSVKTVRITVDDKIIFLDMDEIISIETTHVRHKLRLHTNSRVLEFGGELKAFEEQLDGRFIRCHKSYIINKDKVSELNKKQKTVTMVNNSVCYVSRNGMKLLRGV
jgi:two-component system response regulator AgrA